MWNIYKCGGSDKLDLFIKLIQDLYLSTLSTTDKIA